MNGEPTKKYTIERTPGDIKNLEGVHEHLRNSSYKMYNTDSEIYRDLPQLFLDAVKNNQDLQLKIEYLTAKLDELEDLRRSICHVIKICK